MTLTVNGPAGTPHDPFAGSRSDGGEVLSLPLDRYSEVGADEATLDDLQTYFAGLTREEQREAVAWHEDQTDEELAASLSRFVEARDAYTALGGLTDEEREALDALSEEDREALAALTPEERASLTTGQEAPVAPVQGPDGAPAGETTPETGTGEQGAPEQTFTTTQIGDLTIPEVEALIDSGEVTAEQALAAEVARGDKARSSLVDKLTKTTAAE